MSTRVLKVLAIILPVSFWLVVVFLRAWLFGEERTFAGEAFAVVMLAVGTSLFSFWVFGVIDNRTREIHRRSDQLSALHSAALTLTTELDLGVVLQKVIDLARGLADAKYGALGVLDDTGEEIEQFITSGITPEQRARIGAPPRGHGLLGLLINEGRSIRIPEIERDPHSAGFPPNHPPMHSFLGVPIKSKGRVVGNLYLTDKMADSSDDGRGFRVFTQQDQEVVEMFATQAAIAIENAQLYRKTQQLAILQERERFGMDLHDGIIQSIYAIGLMLEDSQHRLATQPKEAINLIARAIHDLNDVIRDIRNYILELRPQRFQGRDLERGLEELARELRANTFLTVNVSFEANRREKLTAEQTVEILHIAQEALTNIRKHARASSVDIRVANDHGPWLVTVEDNGVGFDWNIAEKSSGHGVQNMRERARALRGNLRVERRENGGTRLTLRVPLLID